jgi:hypothetical protein
LLILRTLAVAKLIPSRVLKKVLVMVTVEALVMIAGNVNDDKAGRALQLMVVADFKTVKDKVDNKVKLLSVKSAPMEVIEALDKLVKPPAFWTETAPATVEGPSREITPAASGPTTMLPDTDEQNARPEASAAELTVIVGCEQRVGVCAATAPMRARAGRMVWANMVGDYYAVE